MTTTNTTTTNNRYEAGVWEQGRGFVGWSTHRTETAAAKAARKYAEKQTPTAGAALSWAGGVRAPDGDVRWIDRDGETIRAE